MRSFKGSINSTSLHLDIFERSKRERQKKRKSDKGSKGKERLRMREKEERVTDSHGVMSRETGNTVIYYVPGHSPPKY